ncbi:hypothetical protein BO78DRAFT_405003 [Aspergillus sclerotiicarbonarius CBS 121057]|uniref:AB hydrolase-1 domain-containing protein n=1 Tax=Aspergillus sclerotiicarbonarius (strain CBS 121057 / IBT 28362) TaxID=1448318 RepID=A0A319ERC9_ASPSB|nr:hypothetical protein BO78DRAFT_405003 [Aspergillus sclerotiicarbonarius CBS 121057]
MTKIRNLAVVICHGSYQTPVPYEPLIQTLQSHGIDGYCPQRPTSDLSRLNVGDVNHPDFDREPPAGGYPSDTGFNQDGKLVLIAAQSSGGWVATQAAVPALQAKPRQAEGKAGGIIGLFYMGAFVIPVGESVTTFFQPKDGTFYTPPFLRFHKHGATGLATTVDGPRFLFNDMDPEDAEKWAAMLTASPIMTERLTNDAYLVLPCAYLVTENDLCLAKEYQEGMITLQSQRGADFTVYHAPSGHSPHLSWTGGVAEKMEEFVGKIWNE